MNRQLTTTTAAALFALTALAPPARAADTKPKAPKATAALLAKGKQVYATSCASCHGEKGDGNGPTGQFLNPKPRNFATEPLKQGGKVEELFKTTTGGVPGTLMVAFGQLPEEDRWAVSYYVLAFLPSKEGAAAKKLLEPAK